MKRLTGFNEVLSRACGGKSFGQYAARVAANGWNPVPIRAGRKRGLPDDWPNYKFDETDLKKYPFYGISILTANTPAVDNDIRYAPAARAVDKEIVRHLGESLIRQGQAPKTLRPYKVKGESFGKMVTGSYSMPGDDTEAEGYKGHKVEILANGEQFVAFNRHPDTGKPYVWTGGDPLTVRVANLRTITLAQALKLLAACEAILAKYGTLIRKDTDTDSQPHVPSSKGLWTPEVILKALSHISNEGTREKWVKICSALKNELGPDGRQPFIDKSHDAKQAAYVWDRMKNPRCTAATIFFYAEEDSDWRRPQPDAETKTVAPSDAPFVLKHHFESVSRMLKRNVPPVSYLFDDLIARGATSILGGPPKGFKSTLMMWWSLVMVEAIESDWDEFKRSTDDPLRVGYIDLEQADPLYLERLEAFKPDREALKRLFRINKFPKFNSDGLTELRNMIVRKRLDAVCLDTLARVRTEGRGRSATDIDAELVAPVTQLSHDLNVHIMLAQHCGKRKDYENPIDMLAATSALPGAVDDCLILFKPPEAEKELRRTLFVSGRHIRRPGSYLLDRTDTGWDFLGEAAKVMEGRLQKEALAVLRSSDKPITPTAIGKILGKQRIAVQKVLPKLIERNLIVSHGDGTYDAIDNVIKRRQR